jgi:hypothetical protein
MLKIFPLLLIACLALSACSSVKPWQRGYLSKDVMQTSQDPMAATLDNHIHFSKEGSSGGGQAAGGGCGCN